MFNAPCKRNIGLNAKNFTGISSRIVYNTPENSIQKAAPVGAALHETNGPVWA